MLAFAFALLSAATSVLAHGIVEEMTVSNPAATYVSYNPYQDPYKNPVPDRLTRKFPSNGPVEDVTGADIQCNVGAEPAALVGTVAAGAQIAFNWTTAWPTSHIGPVITYMARAPSDITKWSPGSDAVWFKVDEAGLENGKWAATDVLIANGGIHSVTIPSSLKAGQYLIRHEIIALHGAQTYPGAQFYPMCAQFEVTGTGTALPDDSTLVSFPGAYGTDEPGVVYNPYVGATTYPIPGPAVWDGTGSGSGSGGAASSTAASPTTTTSAAPSSTVVASSTEAPAEEPTEAVPTAVASSTEAAVSTQAPASTEAPEEISAPATSAPATSAPATSAPATSAPATSAPATSAPAAPTTTQADPTSTKAPAPSTTAGAGALATHYAQCGGKNHNGPTACEAPYTCKEWNEWYSQCV